GGRAVEHGRTLAEHTLDGEDEVRGTVDECLFHRSRSGTVSKPIARSSACAARKSVFSENCGPISCKPTGSPSESPHGIESPGNPARQDGIVRTSLRYMESGSAARSPMRKATVGEVAQRGRRSTRRPGGAPRWGVSRPVAACP